MNAVVRRLTENLDAVRLRIASACQSVGRDPASVRLIAVTKYAQESWIEGLLELGLREFGENRPLQLAARQTRWPQVSWHLIGHLQRNKVASIVDRAAYIHSVDSMRLAKMLSGVRTENPGPLLRIFCEVNVSGESTKDGWAPDELRQSWDQILSLPGLIVCGLMTMAPLTDDPELARPVFRQLRELRDELQLCSPSEVSLPELSMGMSGDFEVAIKEGATMVRIGSRLFEGLS